MSFHQANIHENHTDRLLFVAGVFVPIFDCSGLNMKAGMSSLPSWSGTIKVSSMLQPPSVSEI